MTAQTVGLATIDAGRSAFLTASYCVAVPFVTWIVCARRPALMQVAAAIVCLAGVGFVSLKTGGAASGSAFALGRGDWLTLLCALLCAINIVLLGVFTKRFHPTAMTFMEFLVAGILYLVMSCLSFSGPSVAWLRPEVVSSVLFLIVCASMGAQIMENMSLPHLPGSQASIIMCTECLFAAVFSAIFAGERFTMNTVIGFALIFTAMVMSAKCSEE